MQIQTQIQTQLQTVNDKRNAKAVDVNAHVHEYPLRNVHGGQQVFKEVKHKNAKQERVTHVPFELGERQTVPKQQVTPAQHAPRSV